MDGIEGPSAASSSKSSHLVLVRVKRKLHQQPEDGIVLESTAPIPSSDQTNDLQGRRKRKAVRGVADTLSSLSLAAPAAPAPAADLLPPLPSVPAQPQLYSAAPSNPFSSAASSSSSSSANISGLSSPHKPPVRRPNIRRRPTSTLNEPENPLVGISLRSNPMVELDIFKEAAELPAKAAGVSLRNPSVVVDEAYMWAMREQALKEQARVEKELKEKKEREAQEEAERERKRAAAAAAEAAEAEEAKAKPQKRKRRIFRLLQTGLTKDSSEALSKDETALKQQVASARLQFKSKSHKITEDINLRETVRSKERIKSLKLSLIQEKRRQGMAASAASSSKERIVDLEADQEEEEEMPPAAAAASSAVDVMVCNNVPMAVVPSSFSSTLSSVISEKAPEVEDGFVYDVYYFEKEEEEEAEQEQESSALSSGWALPVVRLQSVDAELVFGDEFGYDSDKELQWGSDEDSNASDNSANTYPEDDSDAEEDEEEEEEEDRDPLDNDINSDYGFDSSDEEEEKRSKNQFRFFPTGLQGKSAAATGAASSAAGGAASSSAASKFYDSEEEQADDEELDDDDDAYLWGATSRDKKNFSSHPWSDDEEEEEAEDEDGEGRDADDEFDEDEMNT